MNELLDRLPTAARTGARSLAAVSLELGKRGMALMLIWLMVPLGVAWAQEAPPPPPPDQSQGAPPPDQDQGPPPQQYSSLSPDQLAQLVAPIALYPDSLVAQVLAAATYPTQIVDADRFVQSNQGAPPDQLSQMVDGQPWDPSVKALTAFPSVLSNMDKNLDWTTQLGNAYYNQPQDVMSAVQADRQQAYNSGQLRSSQQEEVTYAPSDIVIAPANPAVVYVPYYNPWVVWGWGHPWFAWYAPPPPPGLVLAAGIGIGFGFGVVIGAWSHWGWGWGHWGFAWGPHPYIAYHGGVWVSRSYTVVNHGHFGYYDRAPGARAFNAHIAANARAAGYAHGYAAGARAGYNHGEANGYNRGFNRGETNGYNRGTQNRPANNFNRPANNYNRPAQNYNRPANNNRGTQNRPQERQQNHPAHNNSRPHTESHDSHSSEHPHR